MSLRLTQEEHAHFVDLMEAVQIAEKLVSRRFMRLRDALESGVDEYEGEEDRDDIYWFQEAISDLDFSSTDAIRDWRARLEALKSTVTVGA